MGDSTRWLLVPPPRAHSGRTRACGVPKNGVARESFVMATDACMLFHLRAGYVGTKPAQTGEKLFMIRAPAKRLHVVTLASVMFRFIRLHVDEHVANLWGFGPNGAFHAS